MSLELQIKELLEDIGEDFIPPLSDTLNIEEYSKKMSHKSTIFSVYDEGKLVAFMSVYCNDLENKIAYGTMLAVVKTHRVYGLGPNLIKTTVDFLKKKSFKVFRLEIYKSNPRVITLYKRLKFQIVQETENSVFVELSLAN